MTQPVFDNVDTAISQVAHFTDGRTLTKNAAEMGVSVDWLSRAVNPDEKPRCPAALIVPLTITTQNFAIVRTICKLVGGVFFQPRRSASHTTHTAKTLKEISDYFGKLAQYESKGYSRREVDDIENEAHEAIASLLSHVDKLRAEAK